jgi:hypothetical protein
VIVEHSSCPNCGAPAELQCDYVGRDKTTCAPLWCRDHLIALNGEFFCRRHVRIQAALHDGVLAPASDNRAPALALWMADDVGEAIVASLGLRRSVRSLPLREVAISFDFFGWEKGWIIAGRYHQDLVTILVADDAPTLVNLRINDQIIPIGVPFWTEERNTGRPDSWTTELREVFRDHLLATVMEAFEMAGAHATA